MKKISSRLSTRMWLLTEDPLSTHTFPWDKVNIPLLHSITHPLTRQMQSVQLICFDIIGLIFVWEICISENVENYNLVLSASAALIRFSSTRTDKKFYILWLQNFKLHFSWISDTQLVSRIILPFKGHRSRIFSIIFDKKHASLWKRGHLEFIAG